MTQKLTERELMIAVQREVKAALAELEAALPAAIDMCFFELNSLAYECIGQAKAIASVRMVFDWDINSKHQHLIEASTALEDLKDAIADRQRTIEDMQRTLDDSALWEDGNAAA